MGHAPKVWARTVCIGLSLATFASVKTPTYWPVKLGFIGLLRMTCLSGLHILEVHSDLSRNAVTKAEVRGRDL